MRFRDRIRVSLASPVSVSVSGSPLSSPNAESGSDTSATGQPQGTDQPTTSPPGSSSQGNGGHVCRVQLLLTYAPNHILRQYTTPRTSDPPPAGSISMPSNSADTQPRLGARETASRSSSPEDIPSGRNAIEVVLDLYLDANPDIDAVVVSWDTLYTKWTSSRRSNAESSFSFTSIQTDGDGKPCVSIHTCENTHACHLKNVSVSSTSSTPLAPRWSRLMCGR